VNITWAVGGLSCPRRGAARIYPRRRKLLVRSWCLFWKFWNALMGPGHRLVAAALATWRHAGITPPPADDLEVTWLLQVQSAFRAELAHVGSRRAAGDLH